MTYWELFGWPPPGGGNMIGIFATREEAIEMVRDLVANDWSYDHIGLSEVYEEGEYKRGDFYKHTWLGDGLRVVVEESD